MDMIYDRLNDQNIEGDSALLHWLEHYHWGLILFFLYGFPDAYALEGVPWLVSTVSSPFHLGFGLSLILDESRGETRFAWKKGVQTPWHHFYESTVIGVMITLLLLLRWLTVPLPLLRSGDPDRVGDRCDSDSGRASTTNWDSAAIDRICVEYTSSLPVGELLSRCTGARQEPPQQGYHADDEEQWRGDNDKTITAIDIQEDPRKIAEGGQLLEEDGGEEEERTKEHEEDPDELETVHHHLRVPLHTMSEAIMGY